jgi:purine-nucleoside phosphorylase
MAYQELKKEDFLKDFGMTEKLIPNFLIVEGLYDFAGQLKRRKKFFDKIIFESKENFFFIGEKNGIKVGYCCAYGPTLSGEIVHQFAVFGSKIIQIGCYGGLQKNIKVGDFLIASEVKALDGVSGFYQKSTNQIKPSTKLLDALEKEITNQKIPYFKEKLISSPTMLGESMKIINEWSKQGFFGVDMESASTIAIANHFNVDSASILYLFDLVIQGQTVLDKNTDDQKIRKLRDKQMMNIVFNVISQY